MKITDVNVSVYGRDVHNRLVTPEMLLAILEDYRIDHAVCYNEYALLDVAAGNAAMVEIARNSGGKLGLSLLMDPALGADCVPGTGNLVDRLRSLKPESLRVVPETMRVPFVPFYWDEVLDAANTLALPIIVDMRYTADFFTHLPDMAAQYPNAKFVLIRYGTCNSRVVMPLLRKCKNVFITTEVMLDHLQIEEITERIGSNNLLFGTGYPVLPASGALGLAIYADIPQKDREAILHGNWEGIRQ